MTPLGWTVDRPRDEARAARSAPRLAPTGGVGGDLPAVFGGGALVVGEVNGGGDGR